MFKYLTLFALVLLISTKTNLAHGAFVLHLGNQVIEAKANQAVLIQVTSDPSDPEVTGFNLNAQLGDGLGVNTEPSFSSINFVAGTIWQTRATTITGGPVPGAPQFSQASVVLSNSGESVEASGLLGTLFIDASGFTPGAQFDLRLSGTDIGIDSNFILDGGVEVIPTILNGTISIAQVPEPSSAVLVWLSVTCCLFRRRRGSEVGCNACAASYRPA